MDGLGNEEFALSDGGVEESTAGVLEETPEVEEEATPEEDEQMTEAETGPTPPKGYVPQKDLDGLRSAKDRELANERRQRQVLEEQLRDTSAQIERRELEILELKTRDMTEHEARVAKREYELDRREREIANRQKLADMSTAISKKQEAAKYLAKEYGVPEEDLMNADSPTAMKLLAETLSKYHRRDARTERTAKGTDKLGAGVPAGRAPTSLQEADRRYANGQMSHAQYTRFRQSQGLD